MSWTTQGPWFVSGKGKILLSSAKLPGQHYGPTNLLSVGTSGSITGRIMEGSAEVHSLLSGAKVKDERNYTIIFSIRFYDVHKEKSTVSLLQYQTTEEANLKPWAFKILFQCNLS
jgi:hypothetical protein